MQYLTSEEVVALERQANLIRQSIIEMLTEAGSGHTAGPLGMADIFTLLYFAVLRHDPKHPLWPDRDRLILSNGHICPVLYATLAHAGYFPVDELLTLRKLGSRLQGHPHREALPGVETSSGPLGSGLSQAVGMALAERIDNPYSAKFFYCLTGDGELNEGQIWEAAMCAPHHGVDNLIASIDLNGQQIDGPTEQIMNLLDLKAKWEAFGWQVIETENGNDIQQVLSSLEKAKGLLGNGKPVLNLLRTDMGYGVDFMVGTHKWHGIAPDDDQLAAALGQLDETLGDY